MDSKHEINSVCSSFSMVSINGQEMDAEQAVDQSMKELQEGLNNVHVQLRRLLMCDERGDPYQEVKPRCVKADDCIKDVVDIAKDIKGLIKQLCPKKPKGWTANDEQKMMREFLDI